MFDYTRLYSTDFKQGGGLNAVNSRVYAVKVNKNCLLDVARETFKENVADIFQLSRTLSEEHSLPLQLLYQEHGFVFTLRKTDLDESGLTELPKGFVNVQAKKGKWFFESIDLVSSSLNAVYLLS
jgi:DNA mismatch repair protein MSH4